MIKRNECIASTKIILWGFGIVALIIGLLFIWSLSPVLFPWTWKLPNYGVWYCEELDTTICMDGEHYISFGEKSELQPGKYDIVYDYVGRFGYCKQGSFSDVTLFGSCERSFFPSVRTLRINVLSTHQVHEFRRIE